jgi:hypothetical protein
MTDAPKPKDLAPPQSPPPHLPGKLDAFLPRGADNPVDPFRHGASKPSPSMDSVARGIIGEPQLLDRVFELLAYLDPERLEALRESIDAAGSRAERLLRACREGTFGRDYIVRPLLGDEEARTQR